jgi:hypothetical protein
MTVTTNYNWTIPDDVDLVKDGAAAIRTLGSSADTTVKNLNPGTTAGDVDYYTTSTAKARIGIGTAGQVLTVNSGATAPEWATSSSGGFTLISTTSLTGASVALTSIPQSYVHLQLIVLNYKSDTASQYLNLRFNQDSSANQHALSTGAFQGAYSFNQTSSQVSKADNPATSQGQIVIDIFNYTNATIRKKGMVYGIGESAGDQNANFCIAYKTTTAISSFDLFPDSGNFSTGTVLLYGVK